MAYNFDKTLAYVTAMALLAKRMRTVYKNSSINVESENKYTDNPAYYLSIQHISDCSPLYFTQYQRYGQPKPKFGTIGEIEEETLDYFFRKFIEKCKTKEKYITEKLCMMPDDLADMSLLTNIIHIVGPVFSDYCNKPTTYAELFNSDEIPTIVVVSYDSYTKVPAYAVGNISNTTGLVEKLSDVLNEYFNTGTNELIDCPVIKMSNDYTESYIPYKFPHKNLNLKLTHDIAHIETPIKLL